MVCGGPWEGEGWLLTRVQGAPLRGLEEIELFSIFSFILFTFIFLSLILFSLSLLTFSLIWNDKYSNQVNKGKSSKKWRLTNKWQFQSSISHSIWSVWHANT